MSCAKSQLAEILQQRTAYMMLTSGFFDESTDEMSGERCYTVAGFIGGLDGFLDLDFAWQSFLERRGVKYFKTSECEYGFGQFAQFRDDPKDLSRRFSEREKRLLVEVKTDAINVIVGRNDIYGIGTVLMLPDYQRLLNEYPLAKKNLPNPYYLCSGFTLMVAGQAIYRYNRDPRQIEKPHLQANLRPVFDSHEEYSGRFKASFDSFCEKNPVSATYLLPPHYEDDTVYRCLQAADVLAYEARRLLIRQEYEVHRPENKAWERLKQRCWKIYKLNYDALKAIADAQEPDVIPISPELEAHVKALF